MSSDTGPVSVRLKLFATYRRYLPSGSHGNAYDLEVPSGTRIADLLARFGIPADGASVVLVDGLSTDPEQVVKECDVVAVFPAMAGG